jgi:hypothetical protein
MTTEPKPQPQPEPHLSCPGHRNDPECLDCLLRSDKPHDRWVVVVELPSRPCVYRRTEL